MTSSNTNNARLRGSWIKILLFAFGLLLLSAVPARGQSVGGCVANFGGVIDGFVNPVPPSQINIDGSCTIRNFPASNPLTSNISFTGTGRGWLVIFDNVDFIGNISCDKSHGNFIWFVNGSSTTVRADCQNLFIPVEKIDKQNPPGPPVASIGVPFTYKLTIPVLFDPLSGIVINDQGSPNDLHSITITDDLNATGASLSYVSHTAFWKASGTPIPHTFSNVGGVLTFSNFPIIPAGQQIIINITVVLNNVPANAPGTQFFNTAKWQFGRLINGIFYQPLPGENGITPPMTIAAPNLVFTKSGPATMNPGQLGQFTLNGQNTGSSDAWNATIVDKLPTGTTGGMCNMTPQLLSAQVFQADGVTPVAGKGPLKAGTDYTLSYAGAPACTLTLNMLSAAAVIGPTQRLIVTYQTQLDANTQNGATLTNVAGTTLWSNGPSSDTGRQSYTCTLTNGTPGVLDCQDAHTVTAVIPVVTITKQVAVVGGGLAVPGATLDYLVHVTNTSANPVNPVVITDNLNAAGAGTLTYVAGSATMNGSPNGVSAAGNVITANYSATYGPLAPGGTIDLSFRATLGSTLAAGTIVTNTGVVTWNTPPQTASASVSITVGGIVGAPDLVFTKSGPATMSLGQWGQFGLNVQNTGTSDAWNVTLLDRLPRGGTGGMCSTTPQVLSAQVFQADGVTPVAGKGPLVPGTDFSISYVGAPTCELTLTVLTAAGTISPNQRLIITYRTQLDANSQNGAQLTNVAGAVQWFNADSSVTTRQAFNRTLTDGTPGVLDFQDAHTVTVVSTTIAITKQVSVVGGGAALPGGQLDYLVHVTNVSTNPATSVVITDDLSTAGADRFGTCRRHDAHEHRGRNVEQSSANGERQRLDRYRRGPRFRQFERHGVARRKLQQDSRPRRAAAAGLDGWAASQWCAGAVRCDGCQRRLSFQQRAANRRDSKLVRAAVHRARCGPEYRQARQSRLSLYQLATAPHQHRRALRQQPPESEPADRAEWRCLQFVDARAYCGRDSEDAARHHATAGNLLRRPGSTGPDNPGGRLLPLRRQLLGSCLSQWWQLPHRGDRTDLELRGR